MGDFTDLQMGLSTGGGSDLFGGGGFTSALGAPLTSTSTGAGPSTVWGGQESYLTDLYGQGSELLGSQPAENLGMTAGREGMMSYANSPALQNLIQSTQGGFNQMMNPQQNPYLQQAMQSAIRPITQNYQENVLSGITDQAVQAGQTGGSRQGIAEGIAGRSYLDTIGDVSTNMAMQDYTQGQQNQLAAMGMSGDIANLGMMPADLQYQAGQAEMMAPWQQLQLQQGLLGDPTVLGGGGAESEGGLFSGLSIGL
jgi:hypothetical protein